MTEIRLAQLQSSLFIKGLVIRDKAVFAGRLNAASGAAFDGDIAIPPIPDDAIPDAPRMLLRSKDGTLVCNVSQRRLDLVFMQPAVNTHKIQLPHAPLGDLALKLRDVLAPAAGNQIDRASLVSNWLVALDQSGRDFLRARFLRDGSPAGQADDIEVHALEHPSVAGCEVNQWVRCSTARKADDPTADGYVTVLVDINTNAEKVYDFTGPLLGDFLVEAQQLTAALLSRFIGTAQP